MTLAWHRLDAWPDVPAALARLKTKFMIAPVSNGNISLMVDLARRNHFPWDAILGAEVVQAYKTSPEAYLRTADMLGLKPEELCLVAAHNSDLDAARACGLKTAFVLRPKDQGLGQHTDLTPEQDWDVVSNDFCDLADQVGV